MKSHHLIWSIILSVSITLQAQEHLAIGQWKSHLPHRNGALVTQSDSHIIYASPLMLIFIDKEDLGTTFYSTVNGLSDVDIAAIHYDFRREQLIVAYKNSNIDVISNDGRVRNIPQLYLNTTINQDKNIYDIEILDGIIYLATGYGITQIDARNFNFMSTVFLNTRVNKVVSIGRQIYAATAEGLFLYDPDSANNFSDFTQWLEVTDHDNDFYAGFEVLDALAIHSSIYLLADDKIWKFDTHTQTIINLDIDDDLAKDLKSLSMVGSDLALSAIDRIDILDLVTNDLTQVPSQCIGYHIAALQDQYGRIWYADQYDGIRYSKDGTEDCQYIYLNSPYYHSSSDLDIKDGTLWVADGGVSQRYQYLYSNRGFYRLEDKNWKIFNEYFHPDLAGKDVLSYYRINAHPNQPKVYIGSYWAGLLELDLESDKINIYDQSNSSLQGAIGDEPRERVTGIDFDAHGNVWVSTFGANRPLNIMSADGQWSNFSINTPANTLGDLLIDDYGLIWASVYGNNGGVLVYDPGEDPLNPADDRQRFITTSNSELPSGLIKSLGKDRDGGVWVGTDKGPILFECGLSALQNDCVGLRRIILQDSIAAYLLEDQEINTIEIDGANRKWFGTNNGLFVLTPEASQQVAHYTTANSPLFSNHITALAFDGQAGIMYIGTQNGIISLQTAATDAVVRHKASQVLVFPNPITPDYHGPIAIRGLIEDAEVKITDVNGALVYQTQALGGQAIWDGKHSNGSRVASGIYLVWSANSNLRHSADAIVTKVMVLR